MSVLVCSVCHGDLAPTPSGRKHRFDILYCQNDGGNCRQIGCKMQQGGKLPWAYEQRRILNAWRRQMEGTYARLEMVTLALTGRVS